MSGSWVGFYEITIVSRIYVAEKVEVEWSRDGGARNDCKRLV